MKKNLEPVIFFFVIFFLITNVLYAQPNKQYYWKGNSGDFNDPTMWWVDGFGSGTSATQAPNSTNSVFFTAAAFSTPNITITINANSNCDSMIWDNAILVANTPTLSGNSSVSIDVYGSFGLATNLDVQYQGMLRFRSQRNGIETIDPKGKMLRLLKLDIDGSANTEFRLLSKLHVADFNNSPSNFLPSQGGFIELLSGTLNTNGQEVSVDFFHSDNNNSDRGLLLNGSKITVDGYHLQRSWKLDFDTLTNNYSNFDATGSHLIFDWHNGYNWLSLGKGLDYDSVTMKVNNARALNYTGVYCYLDMNNSKSSSINHLLLNTRLYFIYSTNSFTVHNLYFKDRRAVFSWHTAGAPHIYLENVVAPNLCDHFFSIGPISSGGNSMTIHKLTPGTLTLNNILLANTNCDVTGGRSYVANNSIDANGNDPNWTINSPSARQLYFRDNVDDNWHTLGNWEEKIGATFSPATCLPTPVDDVFFDANSYSTHTFVRFDSLAYCHDLTFDNSISAGSQLRFYTTLNMFGDLKACPNVSLSNMSQGYIYGYGTADTIQLNNATMNVDFTIMKNADYEIVGNYKAPNRGIHASGASSVLRSKSDSIFLLRFYPGHVVMDSTQVFIYGNDRWSVSDRSGTKTYTGTTTFHFQPVNYTAINIRTLPNVIFYGPVASLYYSVTIEGDVTFLDNGNFSYSFYGNHATQSIINVSGAMTLYNGDMNLAAGKEYTFPAATGSTLTIAGDLNAVGDCAGAITLQTNGYGTATIPVTINGTANIDYASLQGLNNAANPTITATNSIDAGNNSNISFTTGTGTTFYWRAHQDDATDFEGLWADPGHWTTNPTNLVGDSACIPSLLDSVIFDANSFSATSNGCEVIGSAYCRSLIFQADAKLIGTGSISGNIPESPNKIYINESLMLANAMTNFDYRGAIHMVGSGDINTNNTILEIFKIEFDNATGVWELLGDFEMDNSWTSSTTYRRYGIFSLKGGTFNTNNYDLTIPAQFVATGTKTRTLNLGSSTINHLCNGMYYTHWSAQTRYPWDVRTATNFTLNAGTSQVVFADNLTNFTYSKNFYMGDGLTYNRVRFEDLDDPSYIHNSTSYGYAELLGTTYLYNDNAFDSIRMEGGQYYYLGAGNQQILNAPHGKLIANGNSASFVFIESTTSGATAYLHKPYGAAFCLDFVKVKDIEGTKETNMTFVPTSYQLIHPFLEFQTGVNSDNINGSATGIWAFNLPPLVTPQLTGSDSIHLCKYSSPNYAPVTMTGTAPYFLDYTWTDINSNSGSNVLTVNDDDNDASTPYTYYMPLPTTASEIQYQIKVQTSRCGELTATTPLDIWVFSSSQDTLVDFPTTASCELNNEPTWFTFMDDIEGEPILALRDSVNSTDNQALGMTNVEVFFDPTIQTVNYMGINYPYLERHWDIVPANNGPARVRLFFTQAELDRLAGSTYWGNHPHNVSGTLNPATDLQLLKYSSGTIGVGTPTVLPYTVIPMTGTVADPFDDVTAIIALEFEVSSFSHFILIPFQNILLQADLSAFDAQVITGDQVQVDWTASSEQEIDYYEVERSQDAITAETVEQIKAKGLSNVAYRIIDENAYRGTSYYRIKTVDYDGNARYSDWKVVSIEGWDIVRVFPVPTDDYLTIQLSSNQNSRIDLEVYDALGTLVHQERKSISSANSQQLKMTTSQLSAGIYYLKISNNEGYAQQRKFVVQK
ncbi:T9SS type A sorting domain-containing protein [Aureispira anguillae]|uniref:T9SS type A sorting domain-containing protein n=1 Tax=Aureispira anguillae TaxID=2864201 RepID=A0A915YG59_9BACT|nr:T9SS type A sorting domain-containing protein [Aureispira anguillae]BDS12538.1 T9SS type A sorting domain-containing protein [Aureispira anguillae]